MQREYEYLLKIPNFNFKRVLILDENKILVYIFIILWINVEDDYCEEIHVVAK